MLKQKISTDLVLASEIKVREKYRNATDKQALVQAIFSDLDAIGIDSYITALEVYFHVLLALELSSSTQSIKERDRNKLKDLAEKCLRFCQIQPVTSQHSYLYSRLYSLLGANSLRAGAAWESVSQVMIGEYLGRDSKESVQTDAYLRGMQAWQLGHLRIAKVALHTFDIQTDSRDNSIHQEVMRLLIRIYRLSGETEEARSRIVVYKEEYPQVKIQTDFEELLCALQKGDDPKILYDFLQKRRHELGTFELYLGQLWLCASRYRDIWVSFSSIKDRKDKKGEPSQPHEALALGYLSTLETLYNQDKLLQQRLELLGKKLLDIREAADPELALLFLAGAIRWLNRSKQITFAAILLEEYKALSLRYSDGHTVDCSGLIRDVIEQLPVVVDREAVKLQGQLYVGATPRFLKIAQLVTKATFSLAALRLNPLVSEEERNKKRFAVHKEVFGELEQVIGTLKGPMMKAGQLIAAQYYADPNSLQVLAGIYDNAPPLPFEMMKEQLEKELQGEIEQIFKEFTSKPIAVTSMSEVYKAQLHDGTYVAVKVMYPRIDEIMESDLRLLRLLTPAIRHLKSQEQIDIILQQFSKRFRAECDYEKEAETHQTMYALFKGDRDVLIPKVFSELSTRRVLVTEYIEGTRLDHFMREANQEERNRVGTKLFRFGMLSAIKFGIMHIDPHLANFIVAGDQVLAFDFGAVAALSPELLDNYRKVMTAKYFGQIDRVYDILLGMGYIDSKRLSKSDFFEGVGPYFVSPYHLDEVRPFYGEGEGSAFRYLVKTGTLKKISPNPEDFFANLASSISEEVLARLGAQANWHELLGEVLAEAGLIDLDATKIGAS